MLKKHSITEHFVVSDVKTKSIFYFKRKNYFQAQQKNAVSNWTAESDSDILKPKKVKYEYIA
jgi:hypothetical protein